MKVAYHFSMKVVIDVPVGKKPDDLWIDIDLGSLDSEQNQKRIKYWDYIGSTQVCREDENGRYIKDINGGNEID